MSDKRKYTVLLDSCGCDCCYYIEHHCSHVDAPRTENSTLTYVPKKHIGVDFS